MVVYYINKVSERLVDYRYHIEEGDVCMLYDGEVVKTIYIDSEKDSNSIWRDFKFVDTKSLKSYHFPKNDSILCAPVGEKHALGDVKLLTQLIQECKGEWLLDFLNETSAILSGFVDYWDMEILKRLIGYDNIEATYANEATISEFIVKPEEEEIEEDNNDCFLEDDDDTDVLPQSYDIRWFCLSALSCIEGQIDKRSYEILEATLKGETRKAIAKKHRLTQERIRQIVVKATKQAKELLMEQRCNLDKEKEDNARLNVQLNLLKEQISELKALVPKEVRPSNVGDEDGLDAELAELLETPLKDIKLSARASNTLHYMEIKKLTDIPMIESRNEVLRIRNSGRKTVCDISKMLGDFHLNFGMSFSDIVTKLNTYDWHAAKRKWIRTSEREEAIKEKKRIEKRNDEVVTDVDVSVGNHVDDDDVTKEEATIVLTKEIIEAARTPNGGFTKNQLAAIGIAWPPDQDWIRKKVGTMITPSQFEAFNHIEYVAKPTSGTYQEKGAMTYRDVAFNSDDRRKMESILQAMAHFFIPATPRDIACSISRSAWGDDIIREETVDSFLKRLPEVEYIPWGKYILKSRTLTNGGQSASTPSDVKKSVNTSDDKRIGYTIRLFPSQLKGEIIRVRKDTKGIKKLVVKTTNGDIVEVDDLPYLYEVLKRN